MRKGRNAKIQDQKSCPLHPVHRPRYERAPKQTSLTATQSTRRVGQLNTIDTQSGTAQLRRPCGRGAHASPAQACTTGEGDARTKLRRRARLHARAVPGGGLRDDGWPSGNMWRQRRLPVLLGAVDLAGTRGAPHVRRQASPHNDMPLDTPTSRTRRACTHRTRNGTRNGTCNSTRNGTRNGTCNSTRNGTLQNRAGIREGAGVQQRG
jgi:hypothetical protein